MTVPLSVLKSNMIRFTPALPERKTQAIQSLGAGLVEKVWLTYLELFIPVCIYCTVPFHVVTYTVGIFSTV